MEITYQNWAEFTKENPTPIPLTLGAPKSAIPWSAVKIDAKNYVVFVAHRITSREIVAGPVIVDRVLYRALTRIRNEGKVRVNVLPKEPNGFVRMEQL